MTSDRTWCTKRPSGKCQHETFLGITPQDSLRWGRNTHRWVNAWPVKCLRIKQISKWSIYRSTDTKCCKRGHFVQKGPKTLPCQKYLMILDRFYTTILPDFLLKNGFKYSSKKTKPCKTIKKPLIFFPSSVTQFIFIPKRMAKYNNKITGANITGF